MLQLLSFRAGGLFSETDYCIILSHSYLQRFFKVGVLKTFCPIHRKTTVLESLFNQPVSCYFFHERLQRVLVDIAKLSRTPFLQNTLKLLKILYLWNISVPLTSSNLILITQSGFSNHLKPNVYM